MSAEPATPNNRDLEIAEMALAQRDAAVALLDRLELLVSRIGGHMTPDDQATLREARALLEEHGRRVVNRVIWVDRR